MANEVNIDKISIEIESTAQGAVDPLLNLANAIGQMKSALKGVTGLRTLANDLNSINSVSSRLGTVGEDISRLANHVQSLKTAAAGIADIKSLASSLNSLKNIEIGDLSGLQSVVSQISAIKVGNMTNLQTMATSLKDIQSASKSFGVVPTVLKETTKEVKNVGAAARTNTTYLRKFLGIGSAYILFRRASNAISGFVEKSNDYVENLNLFTVSMGKSADEARRFVNEFSAALGLDPSNVMRYMGTFNNLITGLGVGSAKAAEMSKQVTQLGYDMSSFLNIPVSEAMNKIESGLSGISKPLRTVGVSISEQTLQTKLLSLGYQANYRDLTEASKVQLRYIQILDSTVKMQGDLARTIITPANALRILQENASQAGRAIGNALIPMMSAIIPYAVAALRVITNLANQLAAFFGFSIPEIDYSGVTEGLDEIEESATDAAGKVQKIVAPFDELNDISQSMAGASVKGLDIDFDLASYEYDAILGQINDEVEKLMPSMENLIKLLGLIGGTAVFLKGVGWLNGIVTGLKGLSGVGAATTGILGLVAAFGGAYTAAKQLTLYFGTDGKSGDLATGLIGLVTGGVGAVVGGFAIGGPVGAVIAGLVFLTGVLLGWKSAADEIARSEDLEKRFGNIALSVEQVQFLADKLTKTELTIKLGAFQLEQAELDTIEKAYLESVQTLDGYNLRLSLGMDVDETQYKTEIDNFIKSALAYVEQKQLVATMAVQILLGDTEVGQSLQQFATDFYGASYAQLNELGNDLRNVVSTGFVEGEWIPDKLEEAIRLQKEIQEVMNKLADIEFRAQISALELDLAGIDLTYESLTAVMTQAQEQIQTSLAALEDVRFETIKLAELQYDVNIEKGVPEKEAKRIYNETLNAIQSEFVSKKLEVVYGTFDFGMEAIKTAYAEELTLIEPILAETTNTTFARSLESGTLTREDIYGSVHSMATILKEQYTEQFHLANMDMSAAARENIKKLLTAMQPTTIQLQETAELSFKLGKSVPESVSKGLSDAAQLGAIAGDMDAINYLVGEKMTTDATYLEMLATVEGSGRNVDAAVARGILANLQVVKDQATGMITAIKTSSGLEVTNITPTLIQSLKDLGFNVSEGLVLGAENHMKNNKHRWSAWAKTPGNVITQYYDIHSPARLTEKYGAYISEGLILGAEGKSAMLSTRFTTWGNNIYTDIVTAVGDTMSIGSNIGDSIVDGLTGAYADAVSAARTMVDGIQKTFGTISYDPTVDYMALINQAAATGDFAEAARLEVIRNAKISGEGLGGTWEQTYDFTDYLQTTNTSLESIGTDIFSSYETDTEHYARLEAFNAEYFDWSKNASSELLRTLNTSMNNDRLLASELRMAITSSAAGITHAINSMKISVFSASMFAPKGFADGGFPTSGDLFIANERTAEMVGSYGNRTAVANNDQIVDGIAAGVSEGMEGANEEVVRALSVVADLLQRIADKPVISDTDIADANASGSAKRGIRMSGNTAFKY